MIERQIITGLIVSTEYIQKIRDRYQINLLQSSVAKRIASWCIEYYDKYKRSPGKNIEAIFYERAKNNLPKDIAEEIEQDILPSLSDDYDEANFNVDYLVDATIKYFNERHLDRFSNEILGLLEKGKLDEAELLAASFKPIVKDSGNWVDLSDPKILIDVEAAFNSVSEHVLEFPGALGEFWNDQMVRGAFVALMGAEKRGKTFWLLEFAMRAAKSKKKVAFFQAGDMTKNQQIKRIGIYLTRKSDKEKYSGKMLEPIRDCIYNQNNKCQKKERECNFGIFEGANDKFLRQEITLAQIKEELEYNKDYVNCTNCKEYNTNPWGCVWLKEVDTGKPLTSTEAKQAFEEFFIKYSRKFKISTHPSGSLSVAQSETILDIWEKEDGFVPDLILYDYPDIMEDEIKEFRHKQNKIWMKLRGVAQKKNALVVVVTQTDADAYTADLLKLSNFSEDKRKYAHPTAFYGLNQDKNGREKELGLMRINEIVKREGDFSNNSQVYVLQNLRRGRPFLSSYF